MACHLEIQVARRRLQFAMRSRSRQACCMLGVFARVLRRFSVGRLTTPNMAGPYLFKSFKSHKGSQGHLFDSDSLREKADKCGFALHLHSRQTDAHCKKHLTYDPN